MSFHSRQKVETFNATIAFVLAFNLIFFIHELGLVLAGAALGTKPVLYHNSMTYTVMDRDLQEVAFTGGPVATLLAGLLALLLRARWQPNGMMSLFLLWCGFHGLFLFFGQMPEIAFAAHGDFARAIAYFDFAAPVRVFLGLVGMAGVVLTGVLCRRAFLRFAGTSARIADSRQQLRFLIHIAALPWLFGSLLTIPFRIPPATAAILPFISLFVLIWVFVPSTRMKSPAPLLSLGEKIAWPWLGAVLLLLLFFRLVLAPGIAF